MRKTPVWITLSCCLLALAIVALAQAVRKPGLWEMTSSMTYQQSPFPPGMPASALAAMSAPHTVQVCLTQAMIDKYGAPLSQNRDCQITNIMLKPTGMTAEMVCTGRMSGHGDMESSWTDGNVAKGKVHFIGTMQAGPNSMPVEWTVVSTSVYKGPDCGSVKPMPMPADK
jgi:hypothetical protein